MVLLLDARQRAFLDSIFYLCNPPWLLLTPTQSLHPKRLCYFIILEQDLLRVRRNFGNLPSKYKETCATVGPLIRVGITPVIRTAIAISTR